MLVGGFCYLLASEAGWLFLPVSNLNQSSPLTRGRTTGTDVNWQYSFQVSGMETVK